MSSSKADHEARRAARLAAALRENLKKRKEQTRARDGDEEQTESLGTLSASVCQPD